MSAGRWWPHRVAALAVLTLVWPVLLVCLPRATALGQTDNCTLTGSGPAAGSSVTLSHATCQIDPAGDLTGTFFAPEPQASWPTSTPSPCQQGSGFRDCNYVIGITACATTGAALCASADFTLETSAVSAPQSPRAAIRPSLIRAVRPAAGNQTISLKPSAGEAGSQVSVTGSGFAAGPTTPPPTTPPPSTAPPTTPPPTTPPPTTTSPATTPASPTPSRTGQVVPVSTDSFVGPGIGLAVVLVLVALAAVWLFRRPPGHGPGAPGSYVYARVDDAQPQPLIRNVPSRPARTVRVEVHRNTIAPQIGKRPQP